MNVQRNPYFQGPPVSLGARERTLPGDEQRKWPEVSTARISDPYHSGPWPEAGYLRHTTQSERVQNFASDQRNYTQALPDSSTYAATSRKQQYFSAAEPYQDPPGQSLHQRTKRPQMRMGHWTYEEEQYAEKIRSTFRKGQIADCPENITLRTLLSLVLNCSPMRVSKKYAKEKALGKCEYHFINGSEVEQNAVELRAREAKFHKSLGGVKKLRYCLFETPHLKTVQQAFSENNAECTNAEGNSNVCVDAHTPWTAEDAARYPRIGVPEPLHSTYNPAWLDHGGNNPRLQSATAAAHMTEESHSICPYSIPPCRNGRQLVGMCCAACPQTRTSLALPNCNHTPLANTWYCCPGSVMPSGPPTMVENTRSGHSHCSPSFFEGRNSHVSSDFPQIQQPRSTMFDNAEHDALCQPSSALQMPAHLSQYEPSAQRKGRYRRFARRHEIRCPYKRGAATKRVTRHYHSCNALYCDCKLGRTKATFSI